MNNLWNNFLQRIPFKRIDNLSCNEGKEARMHFHYDLRKGLRRRNGLNFCGGISILLMLSMAVSYFWKNFVNLFCIWIETIFLQNFSLFRHRLYEIYPVSTSKWILLWSKIDQPYISIKIRIKTYILDYESLKMVYTWKNILLDYWKSKRRKILLFLFIRHLKNLIWIMCV